MTTKRQRVGANWKVLSLIVLATIAVVAVAGARVSVAENAAPMTFAQNTQMQMKQTTPPPGRGGPGSVKSATGGTIAIKCNGKTTSECCKGISFCGCLYSPMPKKGDEDKPLTCNSSPPKN